jgi:hypothetical protein
MSRNTVVIRTYLILIDSGKLGAITKCTDKQCDFIKKLIMSNKSVIILLKDTTELPVMFT